MIDDGDDFRVEKTARKSLAIFKQTFPQSGCSLMPLRIAQPHAHQLVSVRIIEDSLVIYRSS
jgi:hypothetical protein